MVVRLKHVGIIDSVRERRKMSVKTLDSWPALTLCLFDGFWLVYVRTVTVGTTSSMHLLMKPMTEVVYSSMPLDESWNIFQSVLAKQSCSVAAESSDHFRTERVTGSSCFSFCYAKWRVGESFVCIFVFGVKVV